MTQQPPPSQSGGYYQSQYSQQPAYPPPQQPPPQQQSPPPYPPQAPQYPSAQPQHSAPPQPYSAQPYSPQPQSPQPYPPPYSSQPYSSQPYSSQPQPAYGSPPPYGDQPPPPGGYQPGYFPGGEAPQPPKRSKALIGILGGIGGTVVLGIAAVVGINLIGNAADGDLGLDLDDQVPEVGECITEASTLPNSETEVVACDAADAAWEVIGNDGTWVESDFWDSPEEEICAGYEGTEQMLWIGEVTSDESGDGQVVCLVQVVAE